MLTALTFKYFNVAAKNFLKHLNTADSSYMETRSSDCLK